MSTLANIPPHKVPGSNQSFRVSKAALGLIIVAFLTVGLLVFSTFENINRARIMMETFLAQKGELTIRSIEAGTRSMMRHLREGNPLHTLIMENSREEDIVFIRILNSRGEVLAETGNVSNVPFAGPDYLNLKGYDSVLTHLDIKNGIYTMTRKFRRNEPEGRGRSMMKHHRRWLTNTFDLDNMIITVGLMTSEFDLARQQDVRHSLFMGTILFLVGSAGFYFLFLYQGIRVAQTTLANMKLYTENVIESIPAGLVTLDSDDRIISCNRNATTMIDKDFVDIQGEELKKIMPECPFTGSEICSGIADHAMECAHTDGRRIPVKLSGSSLLDHDGQTIGSVLIMRDMSQIMEMEQQVERSRRMAALGNMAAGIAHEIRNPLGTLRGFAQFFGAKAGDDAESKGYADLMVSEVDRLNQNISGLLQFARPREPQMIRVRVDDLFIKIFALMESDFISHKLTFHWDRNTSIELDADPDLLLQVLLNLLKNSISSTPERGEINLQAKERNDNVCISVTDTGEGMTEQECQKMFDPFFTTKRSGTGLGLAVSHQIIEQHEGSFEVSSAPGLGTKITLLLPGKIMEKSEV